MNDPLFFHTIIDDLKKFVYCQPHGMAQHAHPYSPKVVKQKLHLKSSKRPTTSPEINKLSVSGVDNFFLNLAFHDVVEPIT